MTYLRLRHEDARAPSRGDRRWRVDSTSNTNHAHPPLPLFLSLTRYPTSDPRGNPCCTRSRVQRRCTQAAGTPLLANGQREKDEKGGGGRRGENEGGGHACRTKSRGRKGLYRRRRRAIEGGQARRTRKGRNDKTAGT